MQTGSEVHFLVQDYTIRLTLPSLVRYTLLISSISAETTGQEEDGWRPERPERAQRSGRVRGEGWEKVSNAPSLKRRAPACVAGGPASRRPVVGCALCPWRDEGEDRAEVRTLARS
ncbi:unnamed protein product [Boreogadus saida]